MLSFALTTCTAWLLTSQFCNVLGAGEPVKGFTEEQIYAALVEPAVENGKITASKRQAILTAARKLLDDKQMQELERKLAPFCDPCAESSTALSSAPPVQPAPTLPPAIPANPGSIPQAKTEFPVLEPLSGANSSLFPTCCSRNPWFNKYFDNLSFFGGLDGSKGPEDLGINANLGGRGAMNWGLPIWEEIGLGIQLGTAINFADNAETPLETVSGTHNRVESFTTIGVFQRTDFGINWGVAWDYLAERYWDNFSMSQVRGQIGYELNRDNEIGVWGTCADSTTTASLNGVTYNLRAINQFNVFWRHIWPNEAVTRFWIGVAEDHDRYVLLNPGRNAVDHPFVYGADIYIPLNSWISIFGEANFITPIDTGTVTATLGIAFSLGGRAQAAVRDRFAPLLPLANNPSFAVNLWR
jgi:hypothetical protein